MLAALPAVEPPSGKRARRVLHDQCQRRLAERIVALRQDGHTWDSIVATVGLASSRVRAIYSQQTGAPHKPDDAAIIDNVRLFLAHCQGQPSRRAYAAWPQRLVAAATVENRFGSWAQAIAQAQAIRANHALSA